MLIADCQNIKWEKKYPLMALIGPSELIFQVLSKIEESDDLEEIIKKEIESLFRAKIDSLKITVYDANQSNIHKFPKHIKEFWEMEQQQNKKVADRSKEAEVMEQLHQLDQFNIEELASLFKKHLQTPAPVAHHAASSFLTKMVDRGYFDCSCDDSGNFVFWVSEK